MAFFNEEGPGVDFDDTYSAWEEVAIFQAEYDTIEYALDQYRAMCKKDACEQKPRPSMEFLKQVVHFVGNDDDSKQTIDVLGTRLIKAKAELTKAKGRLDSLENQIRVWQTMSANARKTMVV